MLDHIGIAVADHASARHFYTEALAPLGYGVVMEVTAEQAGGHLATAFGVNGKPSFWISGEPGQTGALHVAFAAASRAAVDAFYQAAIAAGAADNGAPGLRLHYHPNYYAAFVLDPDGHNIEAVCHRSD